MPEPGDPVAGHHLLLRRFDPMHEMESYRDQATGDAYPTPNAFNWDSEREGQKAFSAFDDAVLAAHGLEPRAVSRGRFLGLAGATASTVRGIVRSEDDAPPGPFQPEHDPFPEGATEQVEAAHCLVWRPEPLGQNARKLRERLADSFQPVALQRTA